MQDDDAVVLFNFRADRMVEISKAFEYEDFSAFHRKRFPKVQSYLHATQTLERVVLLREGTQLKREGTVCNILL